MPISSLERASPEITAYLDSSKRHVFSDADLSRILIENRAQWRIADRVTTGHFIDYLQGHSNLRLAQLRSAVYPFVVRHVWRDYSPYELAASVKAGGYLSHASAVFLHNLTDQLPKTIYVNREQTPKPRPSLPLSQESIDRAFARNARRSSYVLEFDRRRFVLLSGKNTGRFGVVTVSGPSGEQVPCTNLVRTLVDIAVRPEYAGGVYQVLEAYRACRATVSSQELLRTLRRLDYVYPFHQAIGFYMSRAGFPKRETERLLSLGMRFNFYLAHGIHEKAYDPTWRLFYPKGF